jgi:uncharacterized protein YqgC (DUF456 family)
MEYFFLAVSLFLMIVGTLGTLLPVIPGIPIVYLGYLVYGLASDWREFGLQTMLWLGLFTVLIQVLDFYAGSVGARKYGASRSGVWGSIIGALLGAIFFSLPGLVVGTLAGAVSGELLAGRSFGEGLRSGWGAFLGLVAGTLFRMAAAVAMTGMFLWMVLT